jgi:hypothetical protein
MKKPSHLTLTSLLLLGFTSFGFAQEITIGSGNTAMTLGSADFSTDASGVSTLSTSANYVSNLATDSSVPSQLGLTGGGWVFNSADGLVVITDTLSTPAVALGDPSVSYGYYFINTTGNNNQPFSMQFTSAFPDTTFNPSYDKASFAVTLTDGSPGPGPTSSSATVTQTAMLGELAVAGGALVQSSPLNVNLGPANEYVTDGGTTSSNFATTAFPNYQADVSSGPDNELVVTVSGTYSENAIVAVSGRVDVVPEPNSFALFLVGSMAGLILHWWRLAHR